MPGAFPGMAEELQEAFAEVAGPLVYRSTTLRNCRAPSGALAGATAITLGSLPAGMTGVTAGDKFGGGLYTFTADTAASGGSIVGAPFTPALVAALPPNAAVAVVRLTDTPCS